MDAKLITLSLNDCGLLDLRTFPGTGFIDAHSLSHFQRVIFLLTCRTPRISDCQKLELLLANGLPPNLHQLEVSGCTSLKKFLLLVASCQEPDGGNMLTFPALNWINYEANSFQLS